MVARSRIAGIAVAAVVIVFLIILLPYIQNLLIFLFQKSVPASSDFQIERELTIGANGGVVDNVTLDLPAPTDVNRTGEVQQVSDVVYSISPTESIEAGVPWLTWTMGSFQGSEQFTVTISFGLHLDAAVWRIGQSDSQNISDIPASLKADYLADEWKIVVNDPSISSAASSIVGGERNVAAALGDIYNWVVANVHYTSSASGDPQSSVETLSSQAGDCDDQAILFCALARATGIPAWIQLGAIFDRSSDTFIGHGWVQTYLPLRSGGGQYVVIDTVNREFLIWSPNKFIEYTDDGDATRLHDYYYSFHCFYDELTYPAGMEPTFSETYKVTFHQDSAERIALSSGVPMDRVAVATVMRRGSVPV
jgi:hypothetical protein